MKTSFMLRNSNRIMALVTGAFLVAANPTRADSPFPYLAQAISRVVAVSSVVNLGQFDYAPGSSLFGAYLRSGQSQGLRTDFQAGVRYIILAAGDEDIRDLDLAVESASGDIVAQDNDSEPSAVLDFTPRISGRYTLRLKNYSSVRPSFCAMVILQKTSGSQFSLAELAEALRNTMTLSRTSGLFARGFAEGCFCLFGGRVGNSQSQYLYDVSLKSGDYFLLAAGSDNITDVDALVIRQYKTGDASGTTLSVDNDSEPVAVCSFEASSSQSYRLEHRNYASVGGRSGFVFSCVMER